MDAFCHAQCEVIVRLLKEAREERGMSKYALAHASGLSQQAIGYMESGQRRPSLETVLRVARALEVDFAVIVRESGREILRSSGR